jgi:hypothetical protein
MRLVVKRAGRYTSRCGSLLGVWGVKTQLASREIRIFRRSAGFETPQGLRTHRMPRSQEAAQ